MNRPKPGSKWKHFKGGEYEVLFLALDTKTELPVVVYKKAIFKEGSLFYRYACDFFTRPLSEWSKDVRAKNGMFVPRFTRVT